MSAPSYWLSASVLTMTSAPSFRQASRPAWNPAASPLLFVSRTMWSTPLPRATSMVRSVEPSSMTSHSTTSKPSTSRGRSASTSGSVFLVEAGDLDDQLHAFGGGGMLTAISACRRRALTARPPSRIVARRARLGAAAAAARRAPGARTRGPWRVSWPPWLASSSTRRIRTTTRTTRCCGGASCVSLEPLSFDGLPRPDRASAGDRVRARCCRCSATAPTASWSRSRSSRFVALVAGLYALGRTRVHAARRRRRGGAARHALRLPVPRRARLHRRSYLALVIWAAVLELRAPQRASWSSSCAARGGRAAAPRGLAAGRPVLAVGRARTRPGASASATPRWRRSGRSSGSRSTSSSRATRCTR